MLKKVFLPVMGVFLLIGCGQNNPLAPAEKPQSGTESEVAAHAQTVIPGERFIAEQSALGIKVYAYYNEAEKNDYLILKNFYGTILRYEKIPGPGIAHHGLTSIKIKSAKFSSYGTFVAIFVERITYNTNHAVIVYNRLGDKLYTFDRTTDSLASGRLLQINNYNFSQQPFLNSKKVTLNLTYQNYDYAYDQVKHQEHWMLNSTVNSLSQTLTY